MRFMARCGVLFLCLLLLSGCALRGDNSDFVLMTSEGTLSEDTNLFVDRICIIIPQDATPILYQKAEELGRALKGQTGVNWYVVTDNSHPNANSKEAFVVLGWANHPTGLLHTASLKQGDYICVGSFDSLVIGARTEDATMQAIDRYLSQCLPYATSAGFMMDDRGFSYQAPYASRIVTLNGIALENWSIVCEELLLQDQADHLQKAILEWSGYDLPVLDSSLSPKGQGIYLGWEEGIESEESFACLRLVENGIRLSGMGQFDVSMAAKQFLALLQEGSDATGVCQVSLTYDQSIQTDQSRFRLGMVLSDFHEEDFSQIEPVTEVTDRIQQDAAEAIFFVSEICPTYFSEILCPRWTACFDDTSGRALFYQNSLAVAWESPLMPGILGAYQIGSDTSGFLWVIAVPGAILPESVTSSSLPLIVTTLGEQLTDQMGNLQHIRTETRSISGRTLCVQCFASDRYFNITFPDEEPISGYWNLTIERIQA